MKPRSMKYWIAVSSSLLLLGCAAPRVVVIPANKAVHYLDAGKSYTAPDGGMFLVPPARMQEILRKLNRP